MSVWQSGQPIPESTFCKRFIEPVRMMACVNYVSVISGASHCIACVTASTSLVRLEVVTVGTTIFAYSLSTLLDCEPPTRQVPCDQAVCTSRCHVACCWLQWAFVLLHWLFSAGHSHQCVPRFSGSRVRLLRLISTGRFQSLLVLTCFSCMRSHTCWID